MTARVRRADPKYARVVRALREQIAGPERGKLTESAIMRRFRVSRNTALRALDMLEAEGSVRRVRGSGTYPVSDVGKTLKSIHILFTDGMLASLRQGGIESFLLFSRLQGVFQWPRIGQCFVKIVFVRLEESLADKEAKILSLGPGSGLFIPTYRGFEDIIDICRTHRFPYITSAPSGMDFNLVAVDHYGGTRLGVEHLVKHAHRRHILFIGQENMDTNPWVLPRYQAYAAVLKAAGLKVREDRVLRLEPDAAETQGRLKQCLARDRELDAIFASSARFFPAIANAVRELGLGVPSPLAIVVYDDAPELSRHTPPITAVRTPLERTGQVMVEKLVEMIEFGFRDDYRILLDDELVVRGST